MRWSGRLPCWLGQSQAGAKALPVLMAPHRLSQWRPPAVLELEVSAGTQEPLHGLQAALDRGPVQRWWGREEGGRQPTRVRVQRRWKSASLLPRRCLHVPCLVACTTCLTGAPISVAQVHHSAMRDQQIAQLQVVIECCRGVGQHAFAWHGELACLGAFLVHAVPAHWRGR